MAVQTSRGLSEKQLAIGYWIATHRLFFHRVHIAFWIAVSAGSFGIFVFSGVNWISHLEQTSQIWSTISDPIVNFHSLRRPQNLSVARMEAVIRDEDSVDIVVGIENPNDIWAATKVEYEIVMGGGTTGVDHITLAPLQKKFLTKLNIPFSGDAAPSVTVTLHDVTWKKFADRSRLPQERWQFSDAQLRSVQSSDPRNIFESEFVVTVTNQSVYGFQEPEVVVLLVDAENVIHAVHSVTLEAITSSESRTLTFRWPKRFTSSLTPSISVNVDQLTEDRIIRK